jgi:hypothetical protein
LREKKLIAQKSKHEPDSLDCHPLIREHFSDKLRKDNPDAWKEAHSRLYEYYKIQAKERPDTIEEMMTPIEVDNLFIFGFSRFARYLIGGDLLFDGRVVLTY